MTWLILVDQEKDFSNADSVHKVMTTRDYLTRSQLFGDTKPKIINLARSYGYQGAGYYCSLLAEARGHRIIPSVGTMAELSRKTLYEQSLPELQQALDRCLAKTPDCLPEGPMKLMVYLGECDHPGLQPFARLLFDWYRVPVLKVTGHGDGRRQIDRISAVSAGSLEPAQRASFVTALERHTRRSWRDQRARTAARYTIAVLIDPEAALSPSLPETLKYFAKVAARRSIDVEPITRNDLTRLAEYDALFIRATTKIDNFTYRFARRAEQEGMPVIDDPQSMIRCTNKVYLAERLTAAGIPVPKTVIVDSLRDAGHLGEKLGWPVVLKTPDGAFSSGVFKCDDEAALKQRLRAMLADSDLVIAQEFLPTSFDWRIGVLDGKPLFACKYHMAKKHWQIVNHAKEGAPDEGRATTVPLAMVPHGIVDTAVRASALMGQGLYGVDLKETERGIFVIEVNDNPDLHHGFEDACEKDAVWNALIDWYWTRLEQ